MKKKLIAICLSALMLTSVTSVNCMAENPYPDEDLTANPVLLFYRIFFEKMTVRQESLFWGISDTMPQPKKFWIIQTKRIMSHLIRFLKMVPSWMRVVMKSLRSFRLRTGRSAYTPLR